MAATMLDVPFLTPDLNGMAHVSDEEEATVESRLLAAVAEVLSLDQSDIRLYDSFADLGGDQRTAMALRRRCMSAGLSVRTKDVLRCHTLAELQTCLVPCAPQTDFASSVEAIMIAPLEIHKASRLSIIPDPAKSHTRGPSDCSKESCYSPQNNIEPAIESTKGIHRAVVLRPKAGPLDGELVAFVALASIAVEVETTGINMIPQSQAAYASIQIAAARQSVQAKTPGELMPDTWVVLEGMPLTESGMVDRRQLRTWAQNMNDEMVNQARSMVVPEIVEKPFTDLEKTLQRLVGLVLHIPQAQVGVNFTFHHLGGDEMSAMELIARCRHESIFLHADEIQVHSIAELASIASQRGAVTQQTYGDESLEWFDLSPMQQLYFQTAMGGNDEGRRAPDGSYRFNQSLLLKIKKNFGIDDLAAALEAVVGHHSMLRSRFSRVQGAWRQKILAEVNDSYTLNHHSVGTDSEVEAIISRTQASIDIESGPIFAADHILTDDGHQMLYLAAHHLVVDLLSWRVIIHDLDELLDDGSLLSQRSMPFQSWVALQKQESQQLQVSKLLPFDVPFGDYTYWGLHGAPNTYGDALEASFFLSRELTTILQKDGNQVFQTDSVDIFLAALMLSFCQTFTDRRVPAIWTQEHGREAESPDVDISETVGWFTSMCPLFQETAGTDDFLDVLRRIKDTRRAIPGRGLQYFASKFFNHNAPDLFAREWPFEIIFSYAGSFQNVERENGALEQLAVPCRSLASGTSDIGAKVGRIALFEISAMVDHGQAKVKFLFNRYSKHQDAIAQWVHNYEHLLLEAIGRLRYHPEELTLADVRHLDISYPELARLNRERVAELGISGPRNIEDVYPVTAMQQHVLVRQARAPESCHLHAIYEFTTPTGDAVDTQRICEAWKHVTNRHAALRTVFIESVTENGLYDQVVLKSCSANMLFIDVSPHDDPIQELRELPHFKCPPALPHHRLTVCQGPMKTYVKLDISETLCDADSIHILFADLRRAYATEKPILDMAAFSYAAYVESTRAGRQKSLAFSTDLLQGLTPCKFPRLSAKLDDSPPTPQNTYFELEISAQDLDASAKAQSVDVGTILRVAWGLVLRAIVGRNDVCFGFQTPGREDLDHAAAGSVAGCFGSTVACRMDLSPYSTLPATLRAAEEQYTGYLAHQCATPSEVSHALGLKGDDRLFNSCLSFTNEPADLNSRFTTRTNFELKLTTLWESSDYDISVNARSTKQGKLGVDMCYRVMSAEQALNTMHTFARAVQTVMASPSTSIGGVDLFGDRDYAQILSWSPDSGKDGASKKPAAGASTLTLQEIVYRQSVQRPDAQAVCAWDGDLSYYQLEDYAARLAHFLASNGIGPSCAVPVILDKSRWAIVTMVAVLKTGAAFVPIDAEELGHLQAILAQLGATIAITTKARDNALDPLLERVIVLSEELIMKLPQQDQMLTSKTSPFDPACVFFLATSASEVRGISFSHSTLVTAFQAQGPAAKITSQSRVMQLSSFNVDVALAEVFTTVVHGGCICVPSAKERLQNYTAAAERMKVNWTYMTPALSRKLDPQLLPSIKVVCFRTHCLDEDTHSAWVGRANVISSYGAPDVCPLAISFVEVVAMHQLCRIAKPFTGHFWIVDPEDHRRLMPVGAVGELVIEGPTLGVEYEPKRQSTAIDQSSRSRADSTRSTTTRYFKTGHRVRYTEDGQLEFIGGSHDDLEIGGKVLSVSDVEQHVRRALGQGIDVMVEAIAFRGSKDSLVLTAFIELGDKLFDGPEDLTKLSTATRERVHIAKRMVESGLRNVVPAYKIPTIFIPVKHLPIRPSLKVNRRRLQRMIHGMSREQLMACAMVENAESIQSIGLKPLPPTQAEERLRSIWARVLGISEQSISSGDGFLRAGGDDVTAAWLVAACRREGFPVSIADLLQDVSLTEMSRNLDMAESPQKSPRQTEFNLSTSPSSSTEHDSSLSAATITDDMIATVIAPRVGVEPSGIKDIAEATSMQTRYIETGMLRGRANIDYFVFNFTGVVKANQLEEACQLLPSIHPILRTAFVPHNRKVYQVVLRRFNADFKKISCPAFRLAAVAERIIKKDQAESVSFAAPLTKFIFLDAGKQSTLIMRLTKAKYDNVSIALLVKDLKKLYSGTQNLPRRASYCDFVRASQLNASDAEAYWRALLDGAVMTQVCAHSRPHSLSKAIKTVRNRMPVGSLVNIGVSFDTVVKAAWAVVLATLSASSDVVFGEIVEGRHVRLPHGQSVAGVVGPTINKIPVRVTFPETQLTPLALLQFVHGQRIASIPHENLGFLQIVEKCTPWPYWTRFSSVVQHQLEDVAISSEDQKAFRLGAANCKLTVVQPKSQDVSDLLVQSIMRGSGRVEISISYCDDRVPTVFANNALRMLCSTIHLLTSINVMQPAVPAASQFLAKPLAIPMLPQSSSDDASTTATTEQLPTPLQVQHSAQVLSSKLPPEQAVAIQTCISKAWNSVLDPRALGVPEDSLHNAAFYDLWGSLIPAAQLATYFSRELPRLGIAGLDGVAGRVSMEEIIEHPTMLSQFELVTRKMRDSSLRGLRMPLRQKAKSITRSASTKDKAVDLAIITTGAASRSSEIVTSPDTPLSGGGVFLPVTDLENGLPVVPAEYAPSRSSVLPPVKNLRVDTSAAASSSSSNNVKRRPTSLQAMGKSIRRIASNMTHNRAVSSGATPNISPATPQAATGAENRPRAYGASGNNVVSPLTPMATSLLSTTISREPPFLPTLPPLEPMDEVAEEEAALDISPIESPEKSNRSPTPPLAEMSASATSSSRTGGSGHASEGEAGDLTDGTSAHSISSGDEKNQPRQPVARRLSEIHPALRPTPPPTRTAVAARPESPVLCGPTPLVPPALRLERYGGAAAAEEDHGTFLFEKEDDAEDDEMGGPLGASVSAMSACRDSVALFESAPLFEERPPQGRVDRRSAWI